MSNDPYGNVKNSVFTKMLRSCIGDYLKDNVKTSVPGYVLSFDAKTQMAEIQIGLKLHRATGEQEDRSPSIYVPVQFWGGSGGTVEAQISSGDEGMLLFSQECIDSWVDQGGVAVKSEPRRFNQNDAVFIPGFRSIPNAITGFANDGIRLRNKDGDAYYWIKNDKSVSAENGAGHIRIEPSGVVSINGVLFSPAGLVSNAEDVLTRNGISLNNHLTSGVRSGDEISGVPIP